MLVQVRPLLRGIFLHFFPVVFLFQVILTLYTKSTDKYVLCVYVQDIVVGVLKERRRNLISVHKELAENLQKGHRCLGNTVVWYISGNTSLNSCYFTDFISSLHSEFPLRQGVSTV